MIRLSPTAVKVISVAASAAAPVVPDSAEAPDVVKVPDSSGEAAAGPSEADCADCDDSAFSPAGELVSAVSCAAAALPESAGVCEVSSAAAAVSESAGVCMDSVRELSVVTASAPGCPEVVPVQPAVSRSIGTSRSTGISRAAAGNRGESALPVQCLRRHIFSAGTLSVRGSVFCLYMFFLIMMLGDFRFSGQ